ncbi:MAG: hypothetical protein ISS59_04295 [Desulfobacteraceae bacterium]|nr:hypothetical protein [Desulfobacteraceae bacterium]
MPKNPLLEQRLNRILKSVALEKPDRTPVVLQYSGFAAYVTNTPMAEYLSTPLKATETMIQASPFRAPLPPPFSFQPSPAS